MRSVTQRILIALQLLLFTALLTVLLVKRARKASHGRQAYENVYTVEVAEQTRSMKSLPSTRAAFVTHAERPMFSIDTLNTLQNLHKSPKYVELLNEKQKYELEIEYGPLVKELRLNSDDKKEFFQILRDKENLAQEVTDSVQAQKVAGNLRNGNESLEAWQAVLTSEQKELDDKINATLGENGARAYNEYAGALGQHMFVEQLDQKLLLLNTPLTSDQKMKVLQLLRAPTDSHNIDSIATIGDQNTTGIKVAGITVNILPPNGVLMSANGEVQTNVAISPDVLKGAASFLYPEQLKLLMQLENRRQNEHRLAQVSHLGG